MLRPQRGKIILAVLLLMGQTLCMLAGPILVRYGIDHGIGDGDPSALNLAGALFIVSAIGGFFFARSAILLVAQVGETFLRDLRVRVFAHLMDLGLDFFEKEQTGRLVARMTSDVDALQELVQIGLTSIVQNTMLFVGALIVIFVLSWQLALVLTFTVPPIYFATRWFQRESNRAYHEVRERIGHNLANLQEGLAGVRVVQAFARENAFAGRFQETNEAQYDANMDAISISIRYFPFVDFCGVAALAAIIGLGGVLVDQGVATVGTVAAFVLYVNNLFEPVQQLSQFYNTVQSSGAALDKLFGLLDTVPSIAERPDAADLPVDGAIVVDHVSFAYGSYDVLHDVSLTIAPGSGSRSSDRPGPASRPSPSSSRGSTTRVSARSRSAGWICATARWRRCASASWSCPRRGSCSRARSARTSGSAGLVPPTPRWMPRSTRSACAIGSTACPRASPPKCASAARGCRRGSASSCRWRAALADPAVLVLDEATSNLDPGTEQAVELALERLTDNRTVVVVAHRLSTAARADRIGVVDGGVLVELGTHDDLVGRGGRYATLFASWSAAVTPS